MKAGRILSLAEQAVLKFINVDRVLPIQLDITNACNLTCRHCYHPHHNNQGAISLDSWLKILAEYDELCERLGYRRLLILCGGEPLISPYLGPILKRALSMERPYRLMVLTNGTVVERLPVEILSGFESVVFQISLDGPDAARHDLVRGQGTFEKSVAGAKYLRSLGYEVEILSVLSKYSAGWINEFFDLGQNLEATYVSFVRMVTVGTARQLVDAGEDRPLEPLELKAAYTEILRASLRTKTPTNTRSPLMTLLHPDLGVSRRSGEAIVINYRGEMSATSRSRIILGNVLKEGLADLFLTHPVKQRLRRGEIEVCGKCEHFDNCGGDRNASYAKTGNLFGADPGCWLNLEEGETNETQPTTIGATTLVGLAYS